jgi:hypothetical protein
MNTKICFKCKEEKPISEFHRNKRNKDGYKGQCKSCCRKYIDDNIEIKREYEKIHRKTDEFREKRRVYDEKYHQTDQYQEYHQRYYKRDYVKENRSIERRTPEYRVQNKKWRDANADWLIPKQREWAEKYRQREDVRVKSSMRARIRNLLKKAEANKYYSLTEVLGCDVETFRAHLESQFTDGMNWLNYGQGYDKWNIDHIKPCIAFDLIDPEEQKKCFHYTNLQPLWQTDNFSKNSFYEGKLIRKKK